MGNRTGETINGTSTTFSYESDDELTSTTGGIVNSYGYNANGEQTSRTLSGTSYSLSFDYDGQLTGISGGISRSFSYDALGRRLTRTAGGTTTQFLSSGNQIWLEAVGGTTTAVYTYGNLLVRKDGEYPLFDGLGSERTVTNGSQTVTRSAIYEGFGQVIATTGSSSNPYMFAATSGYRNDGDAGLLHVGARYYDPQVGRFVTRDTLLDQHPYLYCDHDPVSALDPSGHYAFVGLGGMGLVPIFPPTFGFGYGAWGSIGLIFDGSDVGIGGHYGAGGGYGGGMGGGLELGGGPGPVDNGTYSGYAAGGFMSVGWDAGFNSNFGHGSFSGGYGGVGLGGGVAGGYGGGFSWSFGRNVWQPIVRAVNKAEAWLADGIRNMYSP